MSRALGPGQVQGCPEAGWLRAKGSMSQERKGTDWGWGWGVGPGQTDKLGVWGLEVQGLEQAWSVSRQRVLTSKRKLRTIR